MTIANAQQAGPSDEVSKLRKEVADLRKVVSQRSRSPRGKGAGKRSLPVPSLLALPAPPTSKGCGKKGKTGKGKKGSKGGKKDSSSSSTSPAGITPPTSGRSIRLCRRGMRAENYSMMFRDGSSVSPSNPENVLTQLVRECIAASAVAKLTNHTTNASVQSLPPAEILPFL